MLLPMPQHLSLDFMTDRPSSQRKIIILMIIDKFFKALHLIPVPRLPTTFETAALMFNHMFQYYGLPEAIVSDQTAGVEKFHGEAGSDHQPHLWLSSPG